MPRRLALEWNDNEARVAVASSHGSRVVFEQAFAIDLQPDRSDDDSTSVDIGRLLKAALAARGVGRLDVIVSVGRSSVELRQLTVPPVSHDELPELVRFQAGNEFNALDDNWSLDFVPLDVPDQPPSVLAAAISPQQIKRIHQTCESSGLKPTGLILRPCAAASLLCRSEKAAWGGVRLLVDLLANEADLTVILDSTVAFLRCVRLPGDPLAEPLSRPDLFSEIRRTIAAANNQLGDHRIESLVLFGSGTDHADLADAINQDLGMSVELFDPFAGLDLQGDVSRTLPEHSDRFAPLLGALLDDLTRSGHAIDFLHPRKPPQRRSAQNMVFAGAAAIGVLIVLGIAWGFLNKHSLELDIGRLAVENATLEKQLKAAQDFERTADTMAEWADPDVIWLEELYRLSTNFPSSQQAMMLDLRLGSHLEGGEAQFNCLAASLEDVQLLKKNLALPDLLPAEVEDGPPDPAAQGAPEASADKPARARQRRVDVPKFEREDDDLPSPYRVRLTPTVVIGPKEAS